MNINNTYKRTNKRARSGFTLTEMITVVAIMVVLFAIAVPSITSIRRTMKMMELDSGAKTIYVAAQNRLSELRASGELGELAGAQMSVEPDD